ncbi:3-deoxy-7-phosphoheptulonate synthase [Acetobacterium woodii]|uniref:Phospho-2-dehydro-3-deoxyheptonate aldolase n=1 Tax=Acetobacterium woodii (strain ATCC 29683 / DSM 1030 / JCM 2381 / KCTC 1655 / WB1) TaxID=931626 RepID=H6LKD8_ACEWD|nr:3-deoxy-7-phosphoheptulonate synthase [Acetobacterium woodii]AFA47528.1 phospho-2-dehydro-3-deoxyheptonate aldolase AroH [Acetobacterium woodii DSM 1030]
MSLELIQEIPSPSEIFKMMPLSEAGKKIKAERDRIVKNVFEGKDDRFILIIGPCSADNETAVIDYVSRLSKLQKEVEDKIIIIPRIYTNKPRTTGEGYKGMLHQPDANKKANMLEGIKAIRQLHIRSIEETGLSCADEMLYPENYIYLEDLLTYVAIGARSVENQIHRLTSSGLEIPVGMKNPTSGDITVMLNSIQAAQAAHTFIYRGWEVKTTGNPLAHAILRGSVDQYGRNFPNYHYEDIMYLIKLYEKRDFACPAIIIDLNHANSNKTFSEQPRIAREVIRNRHYDDNLKKYVKGLMIESYLEEGSQPIDGGVYGKSITDSCLGWKASEDLIRTIAEKV